MTRLLAAACAVALCAPAAIAADFEFADKETAEAILTAPDVFWRSLGDLETSIRLEESGNFDREALADRYRAAAHGVPEIERTAIEALLEAEADRIALIDPLLPETIYIVRTSAAVEGGLPHTRANAIIFPNWVSELPEDTLRALFYHELFHVMSRHLEGHRDDAYALIGFEPCAFEAPASLHARRLTNPDAPEINHYGPLPLDGADGVIPYLSVPASGYDAERGGSMSDYFQFGLLEVNFEDGVCAAALDEAGEPVLRDPGETPAYFELVGRNTGYIIHPEETVADNFVLWISGAEGLADPDIPAAIGAYYRALAEAAAE